MINRFKAEKTGFGLNFDVEFEENQQVHCIIGKNGIGKTKLLEHMAKSLIYTHSIFIKDEKYNYNGIFFAKSINENLRDLGLLLPRDIKINGINIKNDAKDDWTYIDFSKINLHKTNQFIFDKPIVFIGAQNRGFTKNINPNNIKILGSIEDRFVETIKRTMSYINGEGLEQEEVANWFVSRLIVNPSFVLSNQNKTDEVVAILELMEKLEPSLKLIDREKNTIKILFDDGKLLFDGIPFDKLSTGFVSIIKIFQEIISAYGGWSNRKDLRNIEGVVFIDEIEAHLHISWQTKIVNILKEFFSKTTFYITTHSPLVLAGLKNGEAYELHRDGDFVKSKMVSNISSFALNDIVNEFFGVDLNREKLDNPNLEKQKIARKLLLELTNSLDGDEQ